MNIATDIDWDIDNDKVCISFKNKEINNCLKEYAVDYKKDNILIKKQKLIMNLHLQDLCL